MVHRNMHTNYNSKQSSVLSPAASSREVNNLLHTLRGEQFRHAQNQRKSLDHLRATSKRTYNDPSLPFSQLFYARESDPDLDGPTHDGDDPSQSTVTGPRPPRSWSPLFGRTSAWRAEVLSLLYPHLSSPDVPVPPLTLLCMRALLTEYMRADDATEFAELVLTLPPHLRRDLLRWMAVHAPLTNAFLYALCAPEGHADGELIVVGPQATLRSGLFENHRTHGVRGQVDYDVDREAEADTDDGWEDDPWETDAYNVWHTLVLLNTPLSTSALLTFPATLTHLGLLGLPAHPILPVHRLPHICPLLEVLDLSYNSWLSGQQGAVVLGRVEWARWGQLKILGVRDCGIGRELVGIVNRGRWVDATIVGAEGSVGMSNRPRTSTRDDSDLREFLDEFMR